MKILLTGATGYIGQRLLPVLLEAGHEVIACVRDKARFPLHKHSGARLSVIEGDWASESAFDALPNDIDAAYYLIHSMADPGSGFPEREALTATHFRNRLEPTGVKQVIYLGGISNDPELSKHLRSRQQVESLLQSQHYALTVLRAGIIVGSGSASFEIIRDLVEKLPIMVAPKWLQTKCQPIAIRNVIDCLSGVLLKPETYNRNWDIGGPDVLTYREMLLAFADVRKLKRWIFIVPVFTPRLSSYWLFFVTSTSFALARNLVDSMKVEVVCRDNELTRILGIQPVSYRNAIRLAFDKIEQHQVISSWKDALTSHTLSGGLSRLITAPSNGCMSDHRTRPTPQPHDALERIWAIGGTNGWYYANFLWAIRGWLDRLAGGVGLRRGRKHPTELQPGDALDFWRVILADRENRRLLLYAEMKLPGEAWLEFRIDGHNTVHQTATFRPKGLLGRLYWYALIPVHGIIFNGMLRRIAEGPASRANTPHTTDTH